MDINATAAVYLEGVDSVLMATWNLECSGTFINSVMGEANQGLMDGGLPAGCS